MGLLNIILEQPQHPLPHKHADLSALRRHQSGASNLMVRPVSAFASEKFPGKKLTKIQHIAFKKKKKIMMR